jgi:PHD/YefM family antitoxin component YafN of YafNO toxin-antitoxin module
MTVHVLKSDKARLQWRRLLEAARRGDDTVIEHYDTPTAALIPYEDYQAVQEYLDDLRAARRAKAVMEMWERDPSTARDFSEFEAEMIQTGQWDA